MTKFTRQEFLVIARECPVNKDIKACEGYFKSRVANCWNKYRKGKCWLGINIDQDLNYDILKKYLKGEWPK